MWKGELFFSVIDSVLVVRGVILCNCVNWSDMGFFWIVFVICWLYWLMRLLMVINFFWSFWSKIWNLKLILNLVFLSCRGMICFNCWMFCGVIMLYLVNNLCIWFIYLVFWFIFLEWIWCKVCRFCCVIVLIFMKCILGWFIVFVMVVVLIKLFLLFLMKDLMNCVSINLIWYFRCCSLWV